MNDGQNVAPQVIQSNDLLGQDDDPETPDKRGILQFNLDLARLTEVIVRKGTVQLERMADQRLICHVTGRVQFERKRVRKRPAKSCDVLAGGVNFRHFNTKFLIDARGYETSLFVMDGSVEVSSVNPKFPEKQMVHAGEWLVARKDEPIPEPKRYRRSDARSGSTECIYSNCKITDKVPIPPPPVFTPQVLIPPPPNPPGQR